MMGTGLENVAFLMMMVGSCIEPIIGFNLGIALG